MARLSYKVSQTDEDYYHVLRIRYEAYFAGKKRSKGKRDNCITSWKGKRVTKREAVDHYSQNYLFYLDDHPIATCRYTIHKTALQPAPLTTHYPEIAYSHEEKSLAFLEMSRAALKGHFVGERHLLFLMYCIGIKHLFEYDCRYAFFEAPLTLARLFNKYMGAELVYKKPRMKSHSKHPFFLVRVDAGDLGSIRRIRFRAFLALIELFEQLSYLESLRNFLLPASVVVRKLFAIDSPDVEFQYSSQTPLESL